MTEATTAAATTEATTAATTTAATTNPATTTPAAETAAAAATAPAVTPASAATSWRDGITDSEAKEFASRLASPADAVKVALDFRKQNSAMIRVPAADAKPEDIAKFHRAIGVPEKPEGYEFDLGREPTEQDKAVQSGIAKIMHENGVPKGAAQALTKAVTEMATAQAAEQDRVALKMRTEATAALQKEWGADMPANIELANRAIRTFVPAADSLLNTVVAGGKLGDHPALVKAFANIGRRMGEGQFIGAVDAGERKSLQEKVDTIMRQHIGKASYSDPSVQQELAALHEKIAGAG